MAKEKSIRTRFIIRQRKIALKTLTDFRKTLNDHGDDGRCFTEQVKGAIMAQEVLVHTLTHLLENCAE